VFTQRVAAPPHGTKSFNSVLNQGLKPETAKVAATPPVTVLQDWTTCTLGVWARWSSQNKLDRNDEDDANQGSGNNEELV
jgi:hypothetical protein